MEASLHAFLILAQGGSDNQLRALVALSLDSRLIGSCVDLRVVLNAVAKRNSSCFFSVSNLSRPARSLVTTAYELNYPGPFCC
jgi:hypothetical protein